MAKKVTIEAFKVAFQKPSLIFSKVKGKEKKAIEQDNIANRRSDFSQKLDAMYQKDPKYFVKLMGYKLAKHWGDASREYWLNLSPPGAMASVVDKIVGPSPSKEKMKQAVAQFSDAMTALQRLSEIDPESFAEAFIAHYKTLDPGQAVAFASIVPAKATGPILLEAVSQSNSDVAKALVKSTGGLSLDEAREIASVNPDFFITHLLVPFKAEPSDRIIDLIRDPGLRKILSRGGKAWTDLRDSTPMLKLLDGVEQKLATKDSDDDKVKKVFEALLKNEGIELSYYSNRCDQNRSILAGMSENDKQRRKQSEEALGIKLPPKPSTQCHNLVDVLKLSVRGILGDDVKITSGEVKHMALTKSLKGLRGGLLPKTFPGNVIKEDDTLPNGQVLFTGNDEGLQSHTWPIINGKAYDPVLGTEGDEVEKAVDNEFKWIVQGSMAKGSRGWYILRLDDKHKCEANDHGFGTMYRLTQKPSTYGMGYYGLVVVANDKIKRVDWIHPQGPAQGLLEVGDIVEEIDGESIAKLSTDQLAAYSRGKAGAKRTFKIRREFKDKPTEERTVEVTAIDPSTLG
jgi:hypothetical protein